MIGDSRAEPSRIMPGSFESWLDKVLDSIFQEGVNSATLNFMNYTFYALFAVLTTLFLGSGLNLHVGPSTSCYCPLSRHELVRMRSKLISGSYRNYTGNLCDKKRKAPRNHCPSQIPSLSSQHRLLVNQAMTEIKHWVAQSTLDARYTSRQAKKQL